MVKYTIREFQESDITYNRGTASKYFVLIDEILKLPENKPFTIPMSKNSEVVNTKRQITIYYLGEPMYAKYREMYRIDLRQSGNNLIVCKATHDSKRLGIFQKKSGRKPRVHEAPHTDNKCIVCGNDLTGSQTRYCSIQCNNKQYRQRRKYR